MRYLYHVYVVEKKTDAILIDKTVAATSDVDAVLKASAGAVAIDQKKCDVVIRQIAELSKEPEVVKVEREG